MTPIQSTLLIGFPWAEHGFGTRQDGAWTPQADTARLHQVHADGVVAVTTPGHHGDGDALITATAGLWLEIRTADCVPIILIDPRQRIVAAIHAGWRGTVGRIAEATVAALTRDWKTNPAELYAAIGPRIGACCFEVGDDVAAHFPSHSHRPGPRAHVDLGSANRDQLIAAGLPVSQIDDLGLCTVCDPAQFHSFCRDRSDGRMVTAVAIRS